MGNRDYNREILEKEKARFKRNIFIGAIVILLFVSIELAYEYIKSSQEFKEPVITDSKYISLELLEKGKTENGSTYEIIRDTKTNILYLKYGDGLTPILNADGKPKKFYETQVDIIDADGNVTSTKAERQTYAVNY